MIKKDEILAALDARVGLASKTRAFQRYVVGRHPICVDTKRVRPSALIVPAAVKEALERYPINGVVIRDLLHNSSFGGFPKRIKSGKTDIHFGYRLDLSTTGALSNLLDFISSDLQTLILDDIPAEVAAAPETERIALLLARRGQGRFRDSLDEKWNSQSALTKIDVRALLRASHIKPWRASTNRERLSPENGILLSATLDAAFDAGLMTFTAEGLAQVAALPEIDLAKALGLKPGAKLRIAPSEEQKVFLTYHHDKCFKG